MPPYVNIDELRQLKIKKIWNKILRKKILIGYFSLSIKNNDSCHFDYSCKKNLVFNQS